jgi:hypothetical protein
MSLKRFGRLAMVVVAVGALGSTVRADEIVHFSNGAEMTIRSHAVEGEMLKLDLGGNNFISFPISMVGKIVNAGQDVFVNRVYYPSNQALPAVPGAQPTAVATGSVIGGPPVGLVRQPVGPGRNGVRLGEASDGAPPVANIGSGGGSVAANKHDDFATAERPRFDPLRPLPPGGVATIDPPGMPAQLKRPQQMSVRPAEPPPTPAPPANADSGAVGQESQEGDTANQDDSASQDPPPNR